MDVVCRKVPSFRPKNSSAAFPTPHFFFRFYEGLASCRAVCPLAASLFGIDLTDVAWFKSAVRADAKQNLASHGSHRSFLSTPASGEAMVNLHLRDSKRAMLTAAFCARMIP